MEFKELIKNLADWSDLRHHHDEALKIIENNKVLANSFVMVAYGYHQYGEGICGCNGMAACGIPENSEIGFLKKGDARRSLKEKHGDKIDGLKVLKRKVLGKTIGGEQTSIMWSKIEIVKLKDIEEESRKAFDKCVCVLPFESIFEI